MGNETWSSWIEWSGGECPISNGIKYQVKFRLGNECGIQDRPEFLDWMHHNSDGDIIAYRYRIKGSSACPEVEFVARKCADWPSGFKWACVERLRPRSEPHLYWSNAVEDDHHVTQIDRAQWLQARKDLGLIMSNAEEELPAEEWVGSVPAPLDGMTAKKYNAYFKDVRHIDTLDVYRVVSLFDCEKHGHPISHAAKKLLLSGSRTGGKDVEADVREAIDTLYRWLEMREEDSRRG